MKHYKFLIVSQHIQFHAPVCALIVLTLMSLIMIDKQEFNKFNSIMMWLIKISKTKIENNASI